MNELEKKIIGEWVDLRESSRHLYSLFEYWKPGREELASISAAIDHASEQGIVEYKHTELGAFFRAIQDVRYRSFSLESIFSHARIMSGLACVTLVQRLIALGTVSLSRSSSAEDAIDADSIEIPLILRDVLARIKEDPDLRNIPVVKNILVQFAVYTREKETLDKLKLNVQDGKETAFYANFKETFDRIFASIRKSYETLLKEEASHFTTKRVLALVAMPKCAPVLNTQARLFMRIRSTIDYVHTDKYKVREELVRLLDAQPEYARSVDAEMKLYENWGKTIDPEKSGATAVRIAKAFGDEVVIVLDRHLQKELMNNEEGHP